MCQNKLPKRWRVCRQLLNGWLETQGQVWILRTVTPAGEMAAFTYNVLNADGIPALHDGQEGDKGGDEPATAQHGRHSHWGHLVSVDQRLAANSIVPEITRPDWISPDQTT